MAKKETLSYRERLRALIEAEGLSIEAFAQAIGRQSIDVSRLRFWWFDILELHPVVGCSALFTRGSASQCLK